MKHLKKKFVLQIKFSPEQWADLQNKVPDARQEFEALPASDKESMNALIMMEDGELVQCFRYQVNGTTTYIPEPNPAVIYFDSARNYFRQMNDLKDKVFENTKTFAENTKGVNGDFYWYFSLASSYAIFLFSAVEAFVNMSIPGDISYERHLKDGSTQVLNREELQRKIRFAEKIERVLPTITNKHFATDHPDQFESIMKLKSFRDEIAHTKAYDGGPTANSYQNLYVMSLAFDYEKTLHGVRDFINYHKADLIEECDCGRSD